METAIGELPGTSAITVRKLKSLEIKTFWDLLNYFPTRYEDYSIISNINQLQGEETVTIKGFIEDVKQIYSKRGLKLQKFILRDSTGKIELTWYNQQYLLTTLHRGTLVSVAGTVKMFFNKPSLMPREFEVLKSLEQETIHTGRLVPIYPEKRGLSSKTIREKIYYVLNWLVTETAVSTAGLRDSRRSGTEGASSTGGKKEETVAVSELEYLPHEIIKKNNLIDEFEAYRNIHFPENNTFQQKAKERLSFDEMFVIQLSTELIREKWKSGKVATPFELKKFQNKLNNFIKKLPFKLTSAQERVVSEILSDLSKTKPMNRFLQGEVGSGKTVVAAIACYLAYLNGYQSLIMAPTEILATQHFQTLSRLFENSNLKIGIRTGAVKSTENADIVVGTHALIAKKSKFKNVGLVIIDEQHRFGVAQRSRLTARGMNPHLLTMTATPIPRTVMLTLHGELDLSIIDEMPKGRIPVKTYLVPPQKRNDCYKWITNQVNDKNTQVFIICPLIEESVVETMQSVRAAKKEYEFLKNKVFKSLSVGLLHGKLKSKEKNEIMNEFKNRKFDILVATSVVEVGVDVPNASIMVIEGADRYGLAQLHQLRGRVGRGQEESYCYLFTDKLDPVITDRLKYFTSNPNGMLLAEYDLKTRGPGTIYGTKQHGYHNLKIASLGDRDLVQKTKEDSTKFLKNYKLDKYPQLLKRLDEYKTQLIAKD